MYNLYELIDYLVCKNVLRSESIILAFKSIDRADFIPAHLIEEAYMDYPLSIGFGQTNSQPTTVAIMLEFLQAQKGDTVLDIGSGSGWTTALLAHIVGDYGFVEGYEKIPDLVEFGKNNLEKYHFKHAVIHQAGSFLGNPQKKYQRILVSAEAKELPQELLSQLEIGGKLVIPIVHAIHIFEKKSEMDISETIFPGFVFVPLIY